MTNQYLNIILPFLKKAKKIIEKDQDNLISNTKYDDSIVTNADITISNMFQKLIKKNFKNHKILDEEKILKEKNFKEKIMSSKYVWIIDPIDGTKTYFNKSYLFSTSISLFENAKPLFGIIYLPTINQLIWTDTKNVHKITNLWTKSETTYIINYDSTTKLNSNSLIYFPVKHAKDYIKNYKYTFIDGYSSYIYTYDVFTNVAKGAFLKDNVSMWDVYGSLPFAKALNMNIYNINNGSTLDKIDFNLFKDNLKVKNIWLICHKNYKNDLFSILK